MPPTHPEKGPEYKPSHEHRDDRRGKRQRSRSYMDAATNAANGLACGLVILMAFAFGYEVIARYVFGNPSGFVNQFAAYTMPFIAFLAAARTLRIQGHVSVDVFTSKLPPRLRGRLTLVTDALSTLILAALVVIAGLVVVASFENRTRSFSTSVTFPEFVPQIVMLVGLTLLFVEQSRALLFRNKPTQNEQSADIGPVCEGRGVDIMLPEEKP